MKVTCIMPTYGRYRLACRSLASFLWQTQGRDAEMVVYNQHHVPLRFDHPQVRVINEPPPAGGIRAIEKRAFELAPDDADLVQKWDDDDIYLPWFIEDALNGIGDAKAWKVAEALMWDAMGKVTRSGNWFEATWLIRRGIPETVPLSEFPRHLSHPVYPALAASGDVVAPRSGRLPPFVYTWGGPASHYSEVGSLLSSEERELAVERFRARNQDFRPDGLMVIPDMRPVLAALLGGIERDLGAETGAAYRAALSQWL